MFKQMQCSCGIHGTNNLCIIAHKFHDSIAPDRRNLVLFTNHILDCHFITESTKQVQSCWGRRRRCPSCCHGNRFLDDSPPAAPVPRMVCSLVERETFPSGEWLLLLILHETSGVYHISDYHIIWQQFPCQVRILHETSVVYHISDYHIIWQQFPCQVRILRETSVVYHISDYHIIWQQFPCQVRILCETSVVYHISDYHIIWQQFPCQVRMHETSVVYHIWRQYIFHWRENTHCFRGKNRWQH